MRAPKPPILPCSAMSATVHSVPASASSWNCVTSDWIALLFTSVTGSVERELRQVDAHPARHQHEGASSSAYDRYSASFARAFSGVSSTMIVAIP